MFTNILSPRRRKPVDPIPQSIDTEEEPPFTLFHCPLIDDEWIKQALYLFDDSQHRFNEQISEEGRRTFAVITSASLTQPVVRAFAREVRATDSRPILKSNVLLYEVPPGVPSQEWHTGMYTKKIRGEATADYTMLIIPVTRWPMQGSTEFKTHVAPNMPYYFNSDVTNRAGANESKYKRQCICITLFFT